MQWELLLNENANVLREALCEKGDILTVTCKSEWSPLEVSVTGYFFRGNSSAISIIFSLLNAGLL